MLLAALLAFAAALSGERQPPAELQAILALSIDPGFEDMWFHTSSVEGLKLSSIGEVVRGQAFHVCVFMAGHAADANGDLDSTYDVKITRPDGTSYVDEHGIELCKDKGLGTGSVVRARTRLGLGFGAPDPLGTYTVAIEVHDRIGQRSARTQETLTLAAFPEPRPFKTLDAFRTWQLSYYRLPTPMRLLDAIADAGVLELGGGAAPDAERRSYLRTICGDNPFLVPLLLERFEKLDPAARRAVLALLAGTSCDTKPFLAAATKEAERKEFEQLLAAPQRDPLQGALRDAAQVDEIWGVFFASGRSAPIERLAQALTLDEQLDGREEDAGTRALEEAVRASLERNLRLPRVRPYLDWILANGKLGEQDAQRLKELLAP